MSDAPANIAPYVEAVGADAAADVFLKLGGSEIYLADRPGARSILAKTIGPEKAKALTHKVGAGYIKVPVAKRWLANHYRAKGKLNAEIARLIRSDVSTVRRWFNDANYPRQQSLFDD